MGLNKSKNLSAAKKTCDTWFSKFIRIRDASQYGTCQCVTCDNVKHYKEMDAGHFMSRRYMATRWDEQNVHAQCQRCNQYAAGEQYKHGKIINLRYGEGTSDYLMTKSRSLQKFTKKEVMELARYYQEETNKLAKLKNIEL